MAFGVGILAFVTFHAIAMIGGMSMVFGPLAFLLLGFYSIFYFAGFGILTSAFKAAAEEKITLTGRVLRIDRTLGPFSTSKEHFIAPGSKPRIGRPNLAVTTRQQQIPQNAILMTDIGGKEVAIGMGMTHERKEQLRDKISAYLIRHD